MHRSTLGIFIIVLLAASSIAILQGAFDSSDHKKTERAVRNYSVGGESFGGYLERVHPNGSWTTEVTQGCRGVARASYVASSVSYQFDYDIPGHMIHPGNEAGRIVLEAFVAAQKAPAAKALDGGS